MRRFTSFLLASAAAVAAGPALAQENGGQSPPPRFNAGVEASGGYDDNLFATRNREKDDFLFLLRPFARLDIGGGNNRANLRAEGELGRYADFGSEDYEDWLIAMDGRALLSPGLSMVAGGEWRWDHESRASPEAENGIEPTEYERGFGYAGLIASGGKLTGRLGATVTRYDFRDVARTGGTINNDDRDRRQAELGGRAGFRLTSGAELFVQGTYDRRDYDEPADDAGFRRDSEGVSLVAGVRRDFGGGFSGEIFAGLLHQDYEDARLADIQTPDFGVAIDWTGPRGIGGSFAIDRTAEETTLAGASAYVLTAGRLSLRSEPHPRLSAGAALTGSHYDYRGAARTEFVMGADFWARYWLGRRIYVEASFAHAQRGSSAAGFDFDQNRFLISLGARLRPHVAAGTDPIRPAGEAPAGAYAGLLAGYGALVTGLDGPRGQGGNTADFGGHGGAAIAVIGYGVLVDSLYLGLEAEASLSGPDWLHVADRVFSMNKENAFGAAARIGLATPRGDLVYGRFGIGSAAFETNYIHAAHIFSGEDRRTGFGPGGGIEARAGRRGFIRAEYVVMSYPDTDIPTGAGAFDNFSPSESQFRIGGGLRFGAPAAEPAEPPPPVDFSGLYAGLQFGHGALVTDNEGVRSGGTMIDISRAGHGGAAGLFAGFGAVSGRLYAAAEAEAGISAINWNIEREPTGRIYSAGHDHSFGASIRAGVLIGRSALLYGRAGAVRTRFDVPYATTSVSVRSRETQTGLRLGGGLEIGLSGNTRIRADYSITEYRAYDIVYGSNADRFDHSETMFRMGILWRI